ncbi:MAG TPA: CDP-diacylglycerol--serine O-phosphatidyltransferase [Coxiellaceae bacterium]|nr:CDP-diacylglycerol--serine O-phosphatidyltransferase [Coxiellaceae bacterium]
MIVARTRPKGIYLLPSLLTIIALFSGFYAIIAAFKGHYVSSCMAIYAAMIFDGLDGRVARLMNASTAFGAEFDSISDMVSFGIAPALLLYTWSLHFLGKPGWLTAFLYATCTGLRVARFNVYLGKIDKRYFQGLATPNAAAFVAGLVWTCEKYKIAGYSILFGVTLLTIVLALLKVSTIRYRSFKDIDISGRVPFLAILLAVVLIVLISFDPPLMLLIGFSMYILSGPIGAIWRWQHRRHSRRQRQAHET